MNKIGIFYAYWTHNWDADFNEYVERAANIGFDVLGVNSGTVANMSNSEKDKLKKNVKKHNLGLTFCTGLTRQYDIASEDAGVRRNGIEFLKKQARMVKYMEAKEVGGILYGSWPTSLPEGATDRRPYIDRSVESMKEVMKTVEDCDVYFCMEVINRYEQFIMNTCDEGIDYVQRVGSDHCKVLLDTFHMNIEEDSFYDAIVKADKKLGQIHVGETNRRVPGRGRMPWDEIVSALKKINYQGTIFMEPFLMSGGEVGRDIHVYRNLNVGIDLDAEAKSALDFIRKKLS